MRNVSRRAWLCAVAAVPFSAAKAGHPSLGLGIGTGTPAITSSAAPVPQGRWALGLQFERIEFDRFSDARSLSGYGGS